MKTILLTTAAMLTVANLHSQGTVNFGNVSERGTGLTNACTLAPISGTAFRASLYYLPFVDGVPAPRSEQFVIALRPDTTSFLSIGGHFAAGTRTTPDTTPPGGIAWFQVKAWEVAFGTSYEQAINNPVPQNGRLALAGTSNIIKVRTGNGSDIAPGSLVASPAPGFGGLRGFYLGYDCIPEPAPIGFGIISLAFWLFVRRSPGK